MKRLAMVRIVLICALVILVLGQLVFAGASRRHNLYRGFQNESNWVQFVPEDEEFAAKIPGLANIPILGVLFKSRDRRKAKTEMVVIVTPETIAPLNPGDPKPYPKLPVTPIPDSQPALHDLSKVTAPPASTPPTAKP